MGFKIEIATASSAESVSWKSKPGGWEWEAFVAKCSKTHRTHETAREYAAMSKDQKGKAKDGPCFIGGLMSGRRRTRTSIVHRQLICLDADFASTTFWEDYMLIYGNTALAYSTHSHTADAPRMRLIIPLDRPVDVNEFEPIGRRIAEQLGIDQFDNTTYQVNRLMYFPTTSKDGAFVFEHTEGSLMSADEILATYANWKNIDEWPVGSRESRNILREVKKQQDPLEKDGVVGAWCRTHPMTETLDNILPDFYEAGDMENCYTWRHGSTSNGLKVFDDKFAYSFHGSDPISMTLRNSFDLVRIHLYGNLDEAVPKDTPTSKLPSQAAMEEHAAKDPECSYAIAKDRFRNAGEDFAEDLLDQETGEVTKVPFDEDWIGKLEVDRKGKFVTCVENLELILLNDPHLRGHFGMNTFASRFEVLGKLPWNPAAEHRPWTDDDWGGLRGYMQKEPYKMERTPKLEDAMSTIKPLIAFNPVRDYLDSLRWDGKPRLDKLFIDYLGVEDSVYSRTVTRKTLLAAVYRIFQPGVKVDNVLTLVGPEGKGKSEIPKRLGGEWFSNTFSFHMLSGGNGIRAIEQIQGIWIVEIAEMAGIRKAEVEAAKGFISAEKDYYRPSHGRETAMRKRQCIFIGTSNNVEFLQSANGNRRYWPLEIYMTIPVKDIWQEFTPDEVNQVWAEAVHAYQQGEQLYIGREVEEMARKKQRQHEEKDDRREAVIRYLNVLLPADWDTKTIHERRIFIESQGEPNFKMGTEVRTQVSAAEVWLECFGGSLKDMSTQNTKPIHNILRGLEEWEPMKSKTDLKYYGTQRGYTRKMSVEDLIFG